MENKENSNLIEINLPKSIEKLDIIGNESHRNVSKKLFNTSNDADSFDDIIGIEDNEAFTRKLIEKSQNNPILISKQARIFAAKRNYQKSLITYRYLFKNFEKKDIPNFQINWKIFDYVLKFLKFEEKYVQNQKESLAIFKPELGLEWYENLLLDYIYEDYNFQFNNNKKVLKEEISKIKKFINEKNVKKGSDFKSKNKYEKLNKFKSLLKKKLYEIEEYDALKKFHFDIIDEKSETNKLEDPYILGTKNIVDKYHSCDISFCTSIDERLKFPFAQATLEGYIYLKNVTHKMIHLNEKLKYRNYEYYPLFIEKFPIRKWNLQKGIKKASKNADVFYCENPFDVPTHNLIRNYLDKLSLKTKDYHNENYQNIIDPNMCVLEESPKYFKWTATEFLVKETNQYTDQILICLRLLCEKANKKKLKKNVLQNITRFLTPIKTPEAKITSPINSYDPFKHKELHVIAEKVLSYALPMLSHLSKPALLLPGKLQAVVKAQRVYLKPDGEYQGVWHRDGKEEHIVAVVIYYYRCSPGLIGGDLEFMDKRPIRDHIWVSGDCFPEDYTKKDYQEDMESHPHARVPVKEGTMVVFSNYQMIHRVLKIVHDENSNGDPNSPDGFCSRDFLLFFIVNQTKPLKTTDEYRKVIGNETNDAFEQKKKEIRNLLFQEQIQPTGSFGCSNEYIYSTGNGSVALLGWKKSTDPDDYEDQYLFNKNLNRDGIKYMNNLNYEPPLFRGVSWALSEGIDQTFNENLNEEDNEEDDDDYSS